jgi:signal transduction histidine kinase/ActR/RegA family two-component response regulator
MGPDNQRKERFKLKPHSVRQSFTLLQAAAFGLALWFTAAAIYLTHRAEIQLVLPMRTLSQAAELSSQLTDAQDDLLRDSAFPSSHPTPAVAVGHGNARLLEEESRKMAELTERYAALPRTADQQRALQAYRQLQPQLVSLLRAQPGGDLNSAASREWLAESRRLDTGMDELLATMTQADADSLRAASDWLRSSILYSYLLVGSFGAFAILALVASRREHRREIWKPFEDLRTMVGRIRQGDLDVSAAIPDSLEFGALMTAFLDMARELRDARELLEQKVRDRTAGLEAAQSELVQAVKMASLGQLVAGVAHEINNPLASILGFSELVLSRPNLDPRVRAPIETVRAESMRLKDLMMNLNAFARRSPQQKTRLDLRHILGRVYELRRHQLRANRIGLHFERPAEPVWIEADGEQIAQVIFNLVLNSEQAIAADRGDGEIWISCGLDGERAWATVRDTGPGIAAENLEHIFEPFFTTWPAGKNTGLGLSISDGILHQHNGTITVESERGAGTTMHISLAAASAPERREREPQTSDGAGLLTPQTDAVRGKSALVIDDEPMILSMLHEHLENRGWAVTALEDSRAARQALEERAYDLVLCDMKMPGLSGSEVLKLVRELRPESARRFILMSGHAAVASEEGIERPEQIAIIQKPFSLKKLDEAIAQRVAAAAAQAN